MKLFLVFMVLALPLAANPAKADCYSRYGQELKRMTGTTPQPPLKTGLPFNINPPELKLVTALGQFFGTLKEKRAQSEYSRVLNLLHENVQWGRGRILDEELLPRVRSEDPRLRFLSTTDLAFGLHDASARDVFCKDGQLADFDGVAHAMAAFMLERSNVPESASRSVANAQSRKPSRAPGFVTVAEQRARDESARGTGAK